MNIFTRSMLFMILTSGVVKGVAQTQLVVQDTRSIPTTPSSYAQSFEAHFKYGNSINLSEGSSNPYYTILGLRGWLSDNSGGKAHELAFSNNGQILCRSGYSPTWESWRKLVLSDENDNVGLGTVGIQGYKLAVNGKIRAQEVKVENANWPDYVFKRDYQLQSLQQTEQHIKDKGHLPGIPSAAEVKVNGVDLGEMNAKLLQKIEELTLHLIDMKKDAEHYKDQFNKLQLEVTELKTKSLKQ